MLRYCTAYLISYLLIFLSFHSINLFIFLSFYLLITVIATLDYSQCVKAIENVSTSTKITSDGRVDCVAVWVDFDLTPVAVARPGAQGSAIFCEISSSRSSSSNSLDIHRDNHLQETTEGPSQNGTENVLHHWNKEKKDFPSHLKLNLKFFPSPITVKKNETVLSSCTSFIVGESDFIYNFKLE